MATPTHRSPAPADAGGPDARTAVVVITHDRRDELLRTLRRLEELPERPHVVVVDNASTDGTAGAVRTQRPAAGTPARLGDLVYLTVSVGNVAGQRSVSIPVSTGAEMSQAQRLFATVGLSVEVVELSVPNHPYAGTRRVVAQYPVSTVPASISRVVTLWVVR